MCVKGAEEVSILSKHDDFKKCCDTCKYYEWYWDKCKKFDCEMDARACCNCHEARKTNE